MVRKIQVDFSSPPSRVCEKSVLTPLSPAGLIHRIECKGDSGQPRQCRGGTQPLFTQTLTIGVLLRRDSINPHLAHHPFAKKQGKEHNDLMSEKRLVAACLVFIASSPLLTAQVRLTGRITNETIAPVAGAKIVASRPLKSFDATSDPTGVFEMTLPEPGAWAFKVDREGFYVFSDPALEIPAPGAAPLELHVALQTIYEISNSVVVKGQPGDVDMDRTTPETTLSSRTLYDIPFPDQSSLRSGLRLIPGLIQDSTGGIHLFGGSESQPDSTFEGFQLNDPHRAI